MLRFSIAPRLYEEVQSHLRGRVEQVGFLLAEFDGESGTFRLDEWHAIPPEGFEYQGAYHVSLTDEAKAEVIKWAWDARACLVEAHSHSDRGVAMFSPSDLCGFREWVPHLFWRLRGRPYAAMVTTVDSFDALAWVAAADRMEQVKRIELEDGRVLHASGHTLADLTTRELDDRSDVA